MIYAVNKRTKAHEVMDPNALYNTAVWEEVHADPDGWIEWHGGECPLPDWHKVEVRLKNGGVSEAKAGDYMNRRWEERDFPFGEGIIAYRPILNADTKPEPPAWGGDGLPPVGCECEVRHLHSTDLEWRIIKITAITNDYVVGYIRDDRESAIRRGPLLEFRPIRSEEDRITEDLERIMYKPAMTREMAARIYEAIRDGKVPGVKLEDT